MYENNVILRTDRPTDLAFWKISNGHISATVHRTHMNENNISGEIKIYHKIGIVSELKNCCKGAQLDFHISTYELSMQVQIT